MQTKAQTRKSDGLIDLGAASRETKGPVSGLIFDAPLENRKDVGLSQD